jgi:hypothetical protein
MPLRESIHPVLWLLLMTGCQGFLLGGSGASRSYAPPDPTARVKFEAERLEHDGTFLQGRFLIGVERGKIRLDKRLVENVSVSVEAVSTCDTQERVPFIEADYLTRPRTDEHLLTLEEGYWYGADLRFLLLAEEVTGKLGPPCIEVTFSLSSFDRHILTRKSFRAWRKGERPPAESPKGPPVQPAPAPGV